MTADLLTFPEPNDDVAIPIDLDEPAVELEPDEPRIEPAVEPDASAPLTALAVLPLVELLPADFKLPALVRFVPNPALRQAADASGTYALSLAVTGAEGLQRADAALQAVRTSLKAIEAHFEEPCEIANALHKRLTGIRAEWCVRGKQAVEQVGQRMYAEQRRLEAIAAEDRRKAQAEADRQAREAARREAEAAAAAQAPAPVVEEMKRQAETATAPPVAASTAAPTLRGSSTVTTWKARIAGTPGSDDPNPCVEQLTTAQRHQVLGLLRAIVDGKAPLAAIDLNWSYLNKRATADKGTLAIAGIEAFEQGSVRAKGTRAK